MDLGVLSMIMAMDTRKAEGYSDYRKNYIYT